MDAPVIITLVVAGVGAATGIGSLALAIYNSRKTARLTGSSVVDTQENTIEKLMHRVTIAENKLDALERGRYRITTVFVMGETPTIESQVIEAMP